MAIASTPPAAKPAVLVSREGTVLDVLLGGSWHMETPPPPEVEKAAKALADPGVATLSLRCADLGTWDSSLLAAAVDLLSAARARNLEVRHELPESLEQLVRLAFAVERKEGSAKSFRQESFLSWFGGACIRIPERVADFLNFLGDVVLSFGRLFSGRSAMRGKDLAEALYECGCASLGIVTIVNLLFGLILAFVGAVQLTNFGAQIYVAGLVGIGMLRVMGAVMVGIVMSGRIGASYAALIGTMQVNEEVDALETMGIPPTDFLVTPRILALTLMVPLLTVFADLMGMVGGFLVGITILDLSPAEYVEATVSTVSFGQGVVGLAYATAFGIVIALFGCYHGIRCERSAQGVGQATTTAVVHSLVGIIVVTAIITVICSVLNV